MTENKVFSEEERIPNVYPAPFIKQGDSISSMMLDVIIALLPALIWGIYVFGFRVLTLTLISVASCVLCELWCGFILKKMTTVTDLSAVVTGLMIAFMTPVNVPLWLPAVGGTFAIIIVKQLFGGIGRNLLNPAICGRLLMSACCGGMELSPLPYTKWSAFAVSIDTSAIPEAFAEQTQVSALSSGLLPAESLTKLIFGSRAGNMGEISAFLLILGGLWLIKRRVITSELPLACIVVTALLTYLFPKYPITTSFMFCSIFSGALIFGAIFLAGDTVTTPVTYKGKLLFGAGVGALTVLFRYRLGEEGIYYAILIMNVVSGYLDRLTRPDVFGSSK